MKVPVTLLPAWVLKSVAQSESTIEPFGLEQLGCHFYAKPRPSRLGTEDEAQARLESCATFFESPAVLEPLCFAMRAHSSLGQGVPVKPGPGLFAVPGLAGSMQHGPVALFGCEPLSQCPCSLFDTIHCYIARLLGMMRPTCPEEQSQTVSGGVPLFRKCGFRTDSFLHIVRKSGFGMFQRPTATAILRPLQRAATLILWLS